VFRFVVGVPLHAIMNRTKKSFSKNKNSLTGLEVLEEDVHGLGLLTEILDDDAGASDDLAGVTLAIDLAETGPLAELLGIRDLDQVDVVLSAESLNELDVLLLSAGLNEDGHMGLASVKSLGALTETASETIVNKGTLQDVLESLLDGHLAAGSGVGSDLDFNVGIRHD